MVANGNREDSAGEIISGIGIDGQNNGADRGIMEKRITWAAHAFSVSGA